MSTIYKIVIIIFLIIILRKDKPMKRDLYVKRLRDSEGRFGRSDKDPASKNRPPTTDIHTVRGVTWSTFQNNASALGYEPTQERFLSLDTDYNLWSLIFEQRFIKPFGSKIEQLEKKNPFIAYNIIDLGFNSGTKRAEILFARLLRNKYSVVDSNITKPEIIDFYLKTRINKEKLAIDIIKMREAYYKSLSTYPTYKNGWIKRINKLTETFYPSLKYRATT
jgi:lysozyme family protein